MSLNDKSVFPKTNLVSIYLNFTLILTTTNYTSISYFLGVRARAANFPIFF